MAWRGEDWLTRMAETKDNSRSPAGMTTRKATATNDKRSDGNSAKVVGLVAALVHAGDAVVPAEAVFVEPGPEEADA